LASMCIKKVAAKQEKEGKGWPEHAARIQQICNKMIGN